MLYFWPKLPYGVQNLRLYKIGQAYQACVIQTYPKQMAEDWQFPDQFIVGHYSLNLI